MGDLHNIQKRVWDGMERTTDNMRRGEIWWIIVRPWGYGSCYGSRYGTASSEGSCCESAASRRNRMQTSRRMSFQSQSRNHYRCPSPSLTKTAQISSWGKMAVSVDIGVVWDEIQCRDIPSPFARGPFALVLLLETFVLLLFEDSVCSTTPGLDVSTHAQHKA